MQYIDVYCMHLITFFYKDKNGGGVGGGGTTPETQLVLINLKNITNNNVTTNFHYGSDIKNLLIYLDSYLAHLIQMT